jgi:hypothetical protein
MVVLRCTKKLLGRTKAPTGRGGPLPARSSTRLGDWTATLVTFGRQQLVLALSSVTLPPAVLPIAPSRTLLARFPEAVTLVLKALGISDAVVSSEVGAMTDCALAPTNDRRRAERRKRGKGRRERTRSLASASAR